MSRLRALTGRAGRPWRLAQDGRAVTAVEYGIVAAFLCLVLLGIFTGFGSVLTTMFTRASTGI